jgi:hypothetical protein
MTPSVNIWELLSEPSLHDALWPYALWRARMVYPTHSEHYANDLIQHVMLKTFAGDLTWDPARTSLKNHLKWAIRSKSRDDRRHVHGPLPGNLDTADHRFIPPWSDGMGAVDSDREQTRLLEVQRRNDAALVELRRLAAEDAHVSLVLLALEQQAVGGGSLLHLTRLTGPQYKSARARLQRLVNDLPARLHPNYGGVYVPIRRRV